MTDALQQNKLNAMAFYDLMFNESRPREAIERYAGDTYIQYNPTSPTAKTLSWRTSSAWRASTPASVSSSSAHSQRESTSSSTATSGRPATSSTRASTIFRFNEGGKVVEHWDVLQVIPETSANDNTMF